MLQTLDESRRMTSLLGRGFHGYEGSYDSHASMSPSSVDHLQGYGSYFCIAANGCQAIVIHRRMPTSATNEL
tara:strand:- start:130 stop:345 length:216 start_codon:yes stop_codon:yes gene_type:complete